MALGCGVEIERPVKAFETDVVRYGAIFGLDV